MEVQTVTNPVALDIPEVQAAFAPHAMAQNWLGDLKNLMAVGGAALILGTDKDIQIDAAAVVVLPQAFTDVMPWCVHFHNDGPRKLKDEVLKAMLAFIRGAGYITFKAFNQSGMPDKVWLKVFKNAGTPRFLGSAYTFTLGDNADGTNSSDRRRRRPRIKPVRRSRSRRPVAAKPVSAAKLKHADKHDAAVVQPARAKRK